MTKEKRKNREKYFLLKYGSMGLISLFMWLPVIIMLTNSFMGTDEMLSAYGGILSGTKEDTVIRILPRYLTLKAFVELLLDSPDFFVMFWNSCRQVFPVLAGQLLVGIPAAWAFARYNFAGRRILFTLYMILMIMPFQVTMVSSYVVLSKLSLLDSHMSVILPGVFSTFPVFIMEKFFREIPVSLIEAAQADGAGQVQIFFKIGIPMGLPGIMSALILDFLEYWNAIEQPMTFLKTKSLFPLSLYLPEITADKMSVSFAASVIMMLPSVLLFFWGQEYLEKGIAASGLKE